jgi:hypothetical protein
MRKFGKLVIPSSLYDLKKAEELYEKDFRDSGCIGGRSIWSETNRLKSGNTRSALRNELKENYVGMRVRTRKNFLISIRQKLY